MTMKKLLFLLAIAPLFLTSCEYDSSNVRIDDIYMEHSYTTNTEVRYINNEPVYFENVSNYYTIYINVENNSFQTAYDIEVDVEFTTSDGVRYTETHYINYLDGYESIEISQFEVFENTRIIDYSADVYWSE